MKKHSGPWYDNLMEVRRQLKINLPGELYNLAMIFHGNGHQLYLVGGAVRDAVLGRTPKDFDVATDATPEQVKAFLKPLGYEILEVGEAFGVIALVLPHPLEKLEIATFREDLSSGRHPMVRFATIKEDVQRRDLTINALFYDIGRSEVVDLVGGLSDLENHIVRTVGKPEDRFAEDRLRVMRAIRFAVKLGFEIEAETHAAIAFDNNLQGVSFERIRDELVKSIESAKDPRRFMRLMDTLDMWVRVLPGLQASTYMDSLVSTRGIDSRCVPNVMALLLDRENPEKLAKKLNYLKYSADEIAQITFLLRFRDLSANSSSLAPKMRKAFQQSKLTMEQLEEYVVARGLPDRELASAFFKYLDAEPFRGEPLMAQGFQGMALGKELQRLESEYFDSMVGA